MKMKWYCTVPRSFLPPPVFATILTGHGLRAFGVCVGTVILAVQFALEWAREPSAPGATARATKTTSTGTPRNMLLIVPKGSAVSALGEDQHHKPERQDRPAEADHERDHVAQLGEVALAHGAIHLLAPDVPVEEADDPDHREAHAHHRVRPLVLDLGQLRDHTRGRQCRRDGCDPGA